MINLCTHSLDFIKKNFSDSWNSNSFCEEFFCSSSKKISFFKDEIKDDFLYNSIFSICHLCDVSLNQVNFITKLANNNCSNSNKILKNFEKCFDPKRQDLKIIPYFDFSFGQGVDNWCISISKNRFFFRDDINNLILLPFDLFFHPIFIVCLYSFLSFCLNYFLLVPEIFQWIGKLKKKRIKCTLLKLFSLRNQLIFNLFVATGFPIFMGILDFFIFFASAFYVLYAYGLMISYVCLSFSYLQIVILWAHYASQSSNLAQTSLSRKHQ